MSEEAGRLLAAAIAQLEERLATKIDDKFKDMEKLIDRKLKEIKGEMKGLRKGMARMKEETGEKMEKMEERIMEKLKTIKNGSEERIPLDGVEEEERSPPMIRSTSSVSGWSSDYDSDYDGENEEARIAFGSGQPKHEDQGVLWEAGDEIIKRMQAERMSKDEEIPSFWNYDPRCLAKEFVGLDQKTFLVDPSTFNICFFDKDILRKISKMLAPMDFLNLSYTCQFLHWRLFTFCTCYAPYTVDVEIRDLKVGYYFKRGDVAIRRYDVVANKTVYTLRLDEDDRQSTPSLAKEEGLRALVARIPSCLRRPFFFHEITVDLTLPFLTKDDMERCLPFILPYCQYARQLEIDVSYKNCSWIRDPEKFIDYQAIDAFLRIKWGWLQFDDSAGFENIILPNRIGHYYDPPLSAIIRTINEFLHGNQNLDYHDYQLNRRGRLPAFFEYFYNRFDEFEEYVCNTSQNYRSLLFVDILSEETGKKVRMRIESNDWGGGLSVRFAIGKEEAFSKRFEEHFNPDLEDCKASSKWYRMETALEPEE